MEARAGCADQVRLAIQSMSLGAFRGRLAMETRIPGQCYFSSRESPDLQYMDYVGEEWEGKG